MNNEQLERYSRQLLMPSIDIDGQRKLLNASIVVIGCGGLGSHAALMLASMGVGHVTLIDDDRIELSNLHRQTAFVQSNIGEYKALALAKQIHQRNTEIRVTTFTTRIDSGLPENLAAVLEHADLWVDCTDSYGARKLINRYAIEMRKPWVSGAAIGWQGQVVAFDGRLGCYRCLYPKPPTAERHCETEGVIGALLPVIAGQQAILAVKMLLAVDVRYNELTLFDAATFRSTSIQFDSVDGCECEATTFS